MQSYENHINIEQLNTFLLGKAHLKGSLFMSSSKASDNSD